MTASLQAEEFESRPEAFNSKARQHVARHATPQAAAATATPAAVTTTVEQPASADRHSSQPSEQQQQDKMPDSNTLPVQLPEVPESAQQRHCTQQQCAP